MRHFALYFQSGAVVETLENKATEFCRIFGFDSPSRHSFLKLWRITNCKYAYGIWRGLAENVRIPSYIWTFPYKKKYTDVEQTIFAIRES